MQGMGILLQGLQSDLNGPSECQKSMEACHGNCLPGKHSSLYANRSVKSQGLLEQGKVEGDDSDSDSHSDSVITVCAVAGTAKTGQILQNKKFKNKIKTKSLLFG